jgi:hypothetical protein
MHTEADFEFMRRRIESLERRNRTVFVATAVFFGAGLIASFSNSAEGQSQRGSLPSTSRDVRADRFILEDEKGKTRAELSMSRMKVPRLRFFDESGRETAALEGETLNLNDYEAKTEGTVYSGGIVLSRKGVPGVSIGQSPTAPGILLMNGKGDSIVLEASAEGTLIALKDSSGFKTSIGTEALAPGKPGETRKTSAASIILSTKDRQILWRAP